MGMISIVELMDQDVNDNSASGFKGSGGKRLGVRG